ncbi:MAG: hypothetical protein GEV28_38055 [Actinophytocola sp.]|uniref:hypothetical protein n=1 Tax=Actinophytocola sp. TaxID=1872138 RepID=UPI0013298FA2|nr:hypothetical protein [Actinophytocola sp.]MPZ85874.1 hypothetical protein [Actinophytocola sp.]
MPDGAATEDNDDATPPGDLAPDDQIAGTVVVAGVYERLARQILPMVPGLPDVVQLPDLQTGGGGAGGTYMFASLEELDTVIGQWEELIEELKTDQVRIEDANGGLAEPAGDQVSGHNVSVSRETVAQMRKHNDTLLRYAAGYTAKLKASRTQMAVKEDGNELLMNRVAGPGEGAR